MPQREDARGSSRERDDDNSRRRRRKAREARSDASLFNAQWRPAAARSRIPSSPFASSARQQHDDELHVSVGAPHRTTHAAQQKLVGREAATQIVYRHDKLHTSTYFRCLAPR